MEIVPFNPETDRESGRRIWEEVGWLNRDEKHQVAGHDAYVEAGRALVGKLDGEVECLVTAAGGSMRYLEEDISFSGVTGVTTSRVARRQGFAGRMTARIIAEETEAGAAISGLGIFEQGFYDKLGYGTGVYETRVSLDPAALTVPFPNRPPKRLTTDDFPKLHECRLRRKRQHGYITFDSPRMTDGQIMQGAKQFGLGFYDEADGGLSHYLWIDPGGNEHGPYNVSWMSYQKPEQFMELMGLIRTLGDQVRKVRMIEPVSIQLQDLVDHPIQNNMITHRTQFETGASVLAYWQLRICNLAECLSKTHLRGDDVRFNLELTDPIERYLQDTQTDWKGVGGEYVITLGQDSAAEPGKDTSLPTMKTTVNAFSRLWLGVRPATGLAVTDSLHAPSDLLEELDWALRLPRPARDWDF